ncbi:MAG: hypothetical protein ACO3UV_04385, partial [Pseudomonadales bacterium]
ENKPRILSNDAMVLLLTSFFHDEPRLLFTRESPTQLDAYATVLTGLRVLYEITHPIRRFTANMLAQISVYAYLRPLRAINAYLSIGPDRIPSISRAFPTKFNPTLVLKTLRAQRAFS